MSFIVIEGDNASGKTTLVDYFRKKGFDIPTLTPEALDMEEQAKRKTGVERINAFINYNSFCGYLSQKNENSLLIRYWISTMAASYADNIFSFDEAIEKAFGLYNKLPVPDFVFCLKCQYDIRIDRIGERKKATGDDSDNVTRERDEKYQQILSEIEKLVRNWYNIDTVSNTPDQVFRFMCDAIVKGKEK